MVHPSIYCSSIHPPIFFSATQLYLYIFSFSKHKEAWVCVILDRYIERQQCIITSKGGPFPHGAWRDDTMFDELECGFQCALLLVLLCHLLMLLTWGSILNLIAMSLGRPPGELHAQDKGSSRWMPRQGRDQVCPAGKSTHTWNSNKNFQSSYFPALCSFQNAFPAIIASVRGSRGQDLQNVSPLPGD